MLLNTWLRWSCCLTLALAFVSPLAAEDKPNAAIVPVPRDAGWKNRHDLITSRAKEGTAEVIFLGDSITQGWEGAGKEAWKKYFAPLKAMNAGIGGDRTQHVLWRLDNGNIDGIKPKLAVIMIGTNNSGNDSAEHIAAGVKAIVEKLRTKLPDTKILLLAVFPRGEKPNPQREKLDQVNAAIAKLDDGKAIHYLDIGPKFLGEGGVLSKEIMPDFLHLSPKGYDIWATSIEPKMKELLGQ